MSGGYWGLGVEWWVLMVSIKFIVNPHIINTQHSSPNIQPLISSTLNIHPPTPITQHSTPHIINTQHSSPNTHPPTFNLSYHQHSTFITQHPTPITQHSIPHIINTQHSSPNTQHSTPHIIITHHPSFPTPLIS